MDSSDSNKIGMQMGFYRENTYENTYRDLYEKSKILNEVSEKITDALIDKNCRHKISFLSDEIIMILIENLKKGDKFKSISRYLTKDQIKFISENHGKISSLYAENVAFEYKIRRLNSLLLYILSMKKYDIIEVGVELGFHNESTFENIHPNLNQEGNILNKVAQKLAQAFINKNCAYKISYLADEDIIIFFENLKQCKEFQHVYGFLNERQKELISNSLYDDDNASIYGKELVFNYKFERLNNLMNYMQHLNLISVRLEKK